MERTDGRTTTVALETITNEATGTLIYRCPDCGATQPSGPRPLLHYKRCEISPKMAEALPVISASALAEVATVRSPGHEMTAAALKSAAKRGEIGAVLTDDEILAAVNGGVLTVDDAMNRDF